MNISSTTIKEIPNFSFPVFLESSYLDDRILKQKLPLELFLKHEGYETIANNQRYTLKISSYEEQPRDTLKLSISTYVGMCADAEHFYGEIVLPHVSFYEYGTNISVSGYKMPCIPHKVELHRPLLEKEILANRKKFPYQKEGDMVNKFNTIEEVITRGEFVVKEYFPGFKLIILEE